MLELWARSGTSSCGSSARSRNFLMIDRDRLVELALRLVSTPSFTGSEEAAAELMRDELASLGCRCSGNRRTGAQRARHLGGARAVGRR